MRNVRTSRHQYFQTIRVLFVAMLIASCFSSVAIAAATCSTQCTDDCTNSFNTCGVAEGTPCDTRGMTNDDIPDGGGLEKFCLRLMDMCGSDSVWCEKQCSSQAADCTDDEDKAPEDEAGSDTDNDESSADAPGNDSESGGGSGDGSAGGAGGGSGSGGGAGSGGGSGNGSGGDSGGGSGSDSGAGSGGRSGGGSGGPPGIPGWPPGGTGNIAGGTGNVGGNVNICVGDGACSRGDPHLTSFDGLRFDFQGVGEFHFARSDEQDIDVQVRYGSAGYETVSLMQALAARAGGARITVVPGRDTLIEIDGEPVAVKSGLANTIVHESGITLVRYDDGYRIEMPLGVVIHLWAGRTYMESDVASENYRLAGLGGSNDGNRGNEYTVRGGATLAASYGGLNYEQLYRQFGDSWRIRQEDSLFDYADGESTATYTDLSYPKQQVDLNDLDAAARAHAESVCREAGVAPGPDFDNCVYDVGFTKDAAFAKTYVRNTVRAVAALDAPGTAAAGSTISVSWTGPANDHDYVSLASPEQPSNEYKTFSYIDKSDTVQLRVPDTPGNYVLRYVLNSDNQIVTEAPIQVR